MQRKTIKGVTGALAAALFVASTADAQSLKITQELFAASDAGEKSVTRTIGNYELGGYHVWGILDVGVGGRNYFGKLSLHREARGRFEHVFELEKGRGEPAKVGTGIGYEVPMPKGAYLNVHVLPFNFEANARPGHAMLKEVNVEAFGGYERKSYYVEGLMHATLPFGKDSGNSSYAGEVSAGKKINGRFAGQLTLAHYGGNAVRADLKCKIR